MTSNGHLVLILRQDEALQIGDAVIRATIDNETRIKLLIVAPKSVPVLRESAIKREAS